MEIKKTSNLILAFGIVSIVVGVFLLFLFSSKASISFYLFRPIVVTIPGCIFLYKTLLGSKSKWYFFAGLFLCTSGFFLLFIDTGIISKGLTTLWPVIVILCGVSFLISGLSMNKKINLSIIVPSFVLICMGIIFLLFSADIITIPLKTFAARWWPVLLILLGLALVLLFWYMKFTGIGNAVYNDNDDED